MLRLIDFGILRIEVTAEELATDILTAWQALQKMEGSTEGEPSIFIHLKS